MIAALFFLVASGKSNRVKRIRKNLNFLLRQTVKCGHCGEYLTGSRSRGRNQQYYYYHCFNKECSMYGKAISKEKLEYDFVEYLKDITPKKDFLDVFKAVVLSLWDRQDLDLKTEAQNYEKQLMVLDKKRKRIFEMREEGSYTSEEFKERKEEVENQIMAIKISLNETRIDQFDIEGTLTYVNSFISNLGRLWLDLATSQVRFQKMVFPEGIPYKRNEGFGTARLGLIYELNRTFGNEKSPIVDYALTGWNQIIAELREWEKIKQAFSPVL